MGQERENNDEHKTANTKSRKPKSETSCTVHSDARVGARPHGGGGSRSRRAHQRQGRSSAARWRRIQSLRLPLEASAVPVGPARRGRASRCRRRARGASGRRSWRKMMRRWRQVPSGRGSGRVGAAWRGTGAASPWMRAALGLRTFASVVGNVSTNRVRCLGCMRRLVGPSRCQQEQVSGGVRKGSVYSSGRTNCNCRVRFKCSCVLVSLFSCHGSILSYNTGAALKVLLVVKLLSAIRGLRP